MLDYNPKHIDTTGQEPKLAVLKKRHWYIFDSSGIKSEVEGDGVVGVQPILVPGQSYQYVSGCNLTTAMGKMHGIYLMEHEIDKKAFSVKIPEFLMIVPNLRESGHESMFSFCPTHQTIKSPLGFFRLRNAAFLFA